LGIKDTELAWRFDTLRGIGGGERGFSKLSAVFEGNRGETGGDRTGFKPAVGGGDRLFWYEAVGL
jgi:hypothetical protein